MIHLWKAELSRIIKLYTYGYFEVNQYLKCSLVCNHVDSKVNSREKLGREAVNNRHRQQLEILRHFPSFRVDKVDMLCHIKGEEMGKKWTKGLRNEVVLSQHASKVNDWTNAFSVFKICIGISVRTVSRM